MSAELKAKLDAANKKSTNLSKKLKDRRKVLLAACVSLSQNIDEMISTRTELAEGLKDTISNLKSGVIKSQLAACVREGRLSKAEFDKIEIDKIALMSADGQAVVLSSYKNRPVSSDLIQHGMDGAKPLSEEKIQLSAGQMRNAIKAQKEGKALAADDMMPPHDSVDNAGGDEDDAAPEVTGKDIDEALKKLEGLSALADKIEDSQARMKDLLSKLQGEDSSDENDEEE